MAEHQVPEFAGAAMQADTVSIVPINPFDTSNFSAGDWIFYLVEDTQLTQSRHITETFGSPALILDDEQVMQDMKSKWGVTCPGAELVVGYPLD